MKKILLLTIIFFFITGCKTQEDIEKEKKEEEISKIKEELQNEDIPQETEDWLIKVKTENVVTVLCITTSKKCENFSKIVTEVTEKYKINSYVINLDNYEDTIKNIYKSEFKLTDYTGYLPYIIISKNDTLLQTHTDSLNKEELITMLENNKLITISE